MINLKWLSNTPIFRRLFIAFVLAALIPGIVIAVLGSIYINTLNSRGQAVQTSNSAIKIATMQLANLQQMNADLIALHSATYANTGEYSVNDPRMTMMTNNLNTDITSFQYHFTQMLMKYQQDYQIATSSRMTDIRNILASNPATSTFARDQQQTLNRVMEQEWTAYLQATNQEILALTSKVKHDEAHTLLDQADSKYMPLVTDWQHIVDISQKVSDNVALVGNSQTYPVIIATLMAALGTMIVVVVIGWIVSLTITQPLSQLATLTRRIAKGETNARATITGRDEIYRVATSMNSMLDNIVHLIQATQAQRDALQAQVEKLVSEVSGVGEGDLSVQAEVTTDALGVLADSFNYMVEELGSLVVRVKMVAHEVELSTASIFDRLTQLVKTGDIQLNQIADAEVEVEHMADSSRQVADRALVLQSIARDARQSAQGGRDAVQQAVEGMGRIHENVQETAGKVQTLGERSREINNIVDAISSIAHQTNRLALDAAIQAAMAGENGRGFGAVAADIRRLAERAKDQASSIARIVRSVREDIGAVAVAMQDTERETSAGSKLTQEAGIALESIFAAVEYQAREIENINQMTGQQLRSSRAVVQIMNGISNSTQESSLSTREGSQNMERLARLVEQLRASVEAFKLREDQSYYVTSSNFKIQQEEEQDNQLTVSGIFRTVTATALQGRSRFQNALPPARPTGPNDPFSFHPLTPNWQNGSWEEQMQAEQQWYGDPYNDAWAGNGNRTR